MEPKNSLQMDKASEHNDVSGNPGHIANVNPLRYRGYYFDKETGIYYLHTRYYDPKVGRFINADGYVTTDSGLSGANMFTYCKNNPVMMTNPYGNKPFYKILEEQANTANAIIEAAKPKPRSATCLLYTSKRYPSLQAQACAWFFSSLARYSYSARRHWG